MLRTFRPVVDPADDQVAALGWMSVVEEVAAGVFELDLDSPILPSDNVANPGK